MMSGGLFNTTLSGSGTVAVHAVGQPVILDCSQQPTYVDVHAAGWSGQPRAAGRLEHERALDAAWRQR